MEEISLTGATLLGDGGTSGNHRHSTGGKTAATAIAGGGGVEMMDAAAAARAAAHNGNNCCEKKNSANCNQPDDNMLENLKKMQQQQQQQHKACPRHGQNGSPCCHNGQQGHVLPVVQLQIPAEQLVKQEPSEVYKALVMLVRMGPLQLLREIVEAWKKESGDDFVAQKITGLDGSGHTLVHWASKRTDEVGVLQYLLDLVPMDKEKGSQRQEWIQARTADNTGMTALHWACTEADALPIIRMLLESTAAAGGGGGGGSSTSTSSPLLEMTDASGCTPLLIAAQYGQPESVAYLLQKGAAVHALDSSRDSATHWAAYKGSSEVLGLLSYYDSRPLMHADAYGQTPIHLAALRGHTAVCRYILQQVTPNQARELLHSKDKNGRTPLALAVHKQKPTVTAVLQHATDQLGTTAAARRNPWRRTQVQFRSVLRSVASWHSWKLWLGLPAADGGDDTESEAPLFPYYYVLCNYALNVMFYFTFIVPMTRVSAGLFWDSMTWHVFNVSVLACSMYALHRCTHTDPGRLDYSGHHNNNASTSPTGGKTCIPVPKQHQEEIKHWRRLYEETLEAFADESQRELVKSRRLCHTCHIVRPPRSKHDKYTRGCVLLFDHHCPFVGATVGLYNYKWFFLVLVTMTLYFISFWILLAYYWTRYAKAHPGQGAPLGTLLMGAYLGMHGFMAAGMLIYHTQLVLVNMTTNEHFNVQKYDYFWINNNNNNTAEQRNGATLPPGQQQGRRFKNPWFKGFARNCMDRFFPSPACYMLHQDHQALLLSHKNSNVSNGNCSSGDVEMGNAINKQTSMTI